MGARGDAGEVGPQTQGVIKAFEAARCDVGSTNGDSGFEPLQAIGVFGFLLCYTAKTWVQYFLY